MKSVVAALFLLALFLNGLAAQNVKIRDSFTPVALVQDVFVNGACKNISNIRSVGNRNGIAYFEGGQSGIGIEKGIILSTGNARNAAGPNNSRNTTTEFGDRSSDVDLVKLTTGPLYDVVGLEFDFVPLDSFVNFRYVFASEEYCEFVGNIFNDVFGFFISGPGINGTFNNRGENVALIPGSNAYVSINTVNHVQNQLFYTDNMHPDEAVRCNRTWSANPLLEKVQYDGFTRPLTARLRLIPCETYRIRLLVADVSDGKFDSAVFLEAESFNIGGGVKLEGSSPDSAQVVMEGCNNGFFRLNRLDKANTAQPAVIRIKVAPASSAKEGVDFERLPREVTIPAGQSFVNLPVITLLDELEEGPEELILQLDFPCACISDTARIFIRDAPRLRSGLKDLTFCLGDTLNLEAKPMGGVPPYSFLWGNGQTSTIIRFRPPRDTFIALRLADQCQRVVKDTIQIIRKTPPQARISGIRNICPGDMTEIPVTFNGNPPFSFTWKADSLPATVVRNISENTFLIKVGAKGKIQLLSFADGECDGEFQGLAEIRHFNLQSIATSVPVSCAGGKDGRIQVEVSGGTPPYAFSWSGGLPDSPQPGGLGKGTYKVTISDANRCRSLAEAIIGEPLPLTPLVFDCSQFTATRLEISNSGGVPPYTYSVDNGQVFKEATLFNELIPGSKYALQIRDSKGCLFRQDFTMPALYQKMIQLKPVMTLRFGDKVTIQPQLNIPETLVRSITWSKEFALSCFQCLSPQITVGTGGIIRVQVTDVFGCTASAISQINVDNTFSVFVPNAFSPNGDGVNDGITVYASGEQVEKVLSFEIYNRFGNVLFRREQFSPNDEAAGWDGFSGVYRSNPGLYLYRVVVQLKNGAIFPQQGTVMLLR